MDPIPAPIVQARFGSPESARPAEGADQDVTFEIEFLDPGVEVFLFTFG
jgi:hypothetical protein